MYSQEKLARLGALSEADLRSQVLLPLLARMGLRAPTEYHGAAERGKDIVCFFVDLLGEKRYLAVVAKAVDLTGSVSSSQGIREACWQVEQCFDVPFSDLFGMKTVTMDEVWVITSGRILATALTAMGDHLQKQNLAKVTRFVSGEQLVGLIDDHFESYWSDAEESPETVRAQRDRSLAFTRALLSKAGAAPSEIESVTRHLRHSQHLPKVTEIKDFRIFHASPYGVEVDAIGADYADSLPHGISNDDLASMFAAARRALSHAFGDYEDALGRAEALMRVTDPRRFVQAFNEDLAPEEPFHRCWGGAPGECIEAVQYLEHALNDVEELTSRLEAAGKLAWAKAHNRAISECRSKVVQFIAGCDSDGVLAIRWGFRTSGSGAEVEPHADPSRTDFEFVLDTANAMRVPVGWGAKQGTRALRADDVLASLRRKFREHLDESCDSDPI